MPKPIHHAFTAGANGILRELVSPVTVLDPISGSSLNLQRAIWDTGATNSAINSAVAKQLGLIATGKALCNTAAGQRLADTYLIHLQLPQGVQILGLNVTDADVSDDMLIGMDVIAMGDFFVQNTAGKTSFSFCIPAFDNKVDVIDKANAVNARNQKLNRKRP